MIAFRGTVTDNAGPWLEQLPARVDEELQNAVETLGRRMNDRLKEKAPVGKQHPDSQLAQMKAYQPGALRDSITMLTDAGVVEFEAVSYSEYVIGGTPPHEIMPHTPGGVLAFFWERVGSDVAFASVHHPGTKANDFRTVPLEETAADAEGVLTDLGDLIDS